MKIVNLFGALCIFIFCLFLSPELLIAQTSTSGSGGTEVQGGEEVFRLSAINIRARIRRPTVQLVPERMKPDFSQVSSSVESLSEQVKERPKKDFYIRKDNEFPVAIDPDMVTKRKRN